MVRRLWLSLVLVLSGFVAGLVLTGRTRTAADSRAEPPAAEQTPAQRQAAAPPVGAVTTGPDFTRVAAQSVKGVANISSLQIRARGNSPYASDPFFRYFFGDDDP